MTRKYFFFPVLLFFAFLSPVHAAGNWCNPDSAPVITISPFTDRISYNFNLSEKELNGFSVDTINPYGNNVITDVGGLMKGGIETEQQMKFGTLTNRSTGQVCYWYTSVDVSIHINPTIYVAREFPKDSCMHNAILAHEQQHVIVDREIVNKYAGILGNAIKEEISSRRIYGPVPVSQEPAIASQMKSRMQSILKQVTNQMSAERKARQQKVDSLSEYERVNHLCKGKR